ncbi:MAG: YifB family Mg chelatase-like AAA ATPase [Pseudomonadota bacterium]
MSLALIYSRNAELQATEVLIEIHLSNGLPVLNMVGLAEMAVKESKDRVRGAILNSRFDFPIRRITINLAPADLPKEGSRFDLAIAIGILTASEQININLKKSSLQQLEFYGELALSGELRPIKGILSSAIEARKNNKIIIIPKQNAQEAALIKGLTIYYAEHLLQVCAFLNGKEDLPQATLTQPSKQPETTCFSEIKGQQQAKRAFEIAAAGSHSLLLSGPPGSGKTMLSSSMPGILPMMTDEQAQESAAIRSISGEIVDINNWGIRPFRSPHHTSSGVALVGGGSNPRPGEISLAHFGVLFLDEIPEFNRHVLEVLREPLESGSISISRAKRQVRYPARFQLIAAMNPCPCGYFGDDQNNCSCSTEQIKRYQNRISGPFLDRIDLYIELQALSHQELCQPTNKTDLNMDETSSVENAVETSAEIQLRVAQAREKQLQRRNKSNSLLTGREIEQDCQLAENSVFLLEQAMDKLNLSARAYHRILRVARTIADLDNKHQQAQHIGIQHLSEAIRYRKINRNL